MHLVGFEIYDVTSTPSFRRRECHLNQSLLAKLSKIDRHNIGIFVLINNETLLRKTNP
jgi:hypothetical protein